MQCKLGSFRALFKCAVLVAVFTSIAGCARFVKYEYESHVFPLDDENELVVSTFPSWFPATKNHIPFLYKNLHAPQSVNFEFFVRATGTTAGRNPNIESILVRNFSYEFPGQAPVVLLSDYTTGFWQQGQQHFDSESLEPVPCVDGWYVRVKFDLVLNGVVHRGEKDLYAQEVSTMTPLLFDALR